MILICDYSGKIKSAQIHDANDINPVAADLILLTCANIHEAKSLVPSYKMIDHDNVRREYHYLLSN